MRLGRIGYINCYPVYGAIDRGVTPLAAELVTGTPSELNDLLAAGELDLSVVSAVEYARNARDYVLLTASSRTAVGLLELLCRDVWKVRPHFAQARAEAADLDELAHLPHEAVLVIGDAALLLAARHAYPHRYDLGEEWKRWTGLPFVFAVWAARRAADHAAVRAVHHALLAARD